MTSIIHSAQSQDYTRITIPAIPIGSVRSIKCGGTWTLIETMNDQLFLNGLSFQHKYLIEVPSPSSGNQTWQVQQIDYLTMIKELTNREDLLQDPSSYILQEVVLERDVILIRMRNDLIVAISVASSFFFHLHQEYCKRPLSRILGGALSPSYVFITQSMEVDIYSFSGGQPVKSIISTANIKHKRIVGGACGGSSIFIIVENGKSHEIYTQGDDQFLVSNGVRSLEGFLPVETPFSGQRIAQLVVGYFHTAVLLENGDIYTCGYNSYSQCGFSGSDSHFRKVTFPANLWDLRPDLCIKNPFKVEKIVCSSIGTLFVSQDGFIMYGDPVPKLGYMTHALVTIENVTAMLYAFGREKVESNLVHSNTVTVGGWHVVVYKSFNKSTKSLTYFMNNLKLLTSVSTLSDITIIHSV